MCIIDPLNINPITRLVMTCNNPYDIMKYTLNFRSYLPIPNGLEFHANQTYYFLSTSSTHRQCNRLKIIVHDYSKSILCLIDYDSVCYNRRKIRISLCFSDDTFSY